MKITWDWFLSSAQLAGLAFLLIFLPISNYFMSLSMFWIAGAWFLDFITAVIRKENIRDKIGGFYSDKVAIVFSSLYLMVLIGLVWTSDFEHAAWDLRMKLPILFMPFLIGALRPISTVQYRWLLSLFVISLFIAVTICYCVYFGIIPKSWNDVREISVFISHIRFSLLLAFGIAILSFEFIARKKNVLLSVATLIYFLSFLWVIESITGFSVLICITLVLLLRSFLLAKNIATRILIPCILIVCISIIGIYLRTCYMDYFVVREKPGELETYSVHGEKYFHDTTNTQLEGGYYIMRNIAWGELSASWNRRSNLDFDSTDVNGNPVKGNLVRYLTSKGLRKDEDAVMSLSEQEIRLIESGVTTVHMQDRQGIRARIDKILFEYDAYRNGQNPSGHSVMQRLEFWKAAKGIISEHPLFGVGTGDVKQEFAQQYDKMNSRLDVNHRLRAHNQYLTFWISCGLFGLVWFILVLFYPAFKSSRAHNPLYIAFLIIVILSCITEDTLETQAGVTFYAFIASLLLFLQIKEEGVKQPQQV